METFAKRLKYAMTLRNVTQSELSRAVNVTPAAVKKWLEGKVASPKAIDCYAVSQFLSVNMFWLISGQGEISENCTRKNESNGVSLATLVPEYTNASRTYSKIGIESLTVNQNWFDLQFGKINPQELRIITAEGDSMSPLINDGDIVFLDIRENSLGREGVYFVDAGDSLFFKRIQYKPGGGAILIPENSKYRDIELSSDELNKIKIYGRVIKCFHVEDIR